MIAEIAIAAALAFLAPAPIAAAAIPEDYTSAAQVETLEEAPPLFGNNAKRALCNTRVHYVTHARVTTYCPACNEPQGYESASGKVLAPGDCACSWLPLGTRISIDGETFTVVDVCGTDAIDLFIDDGTGVCNCHLNYYAEVIVYE